MITERQVQALVAQCVAQMTAYVDSGRAFAIRSEMIARIRDLAGLAARSGLSHDDADERIVQPVRDALLSVHGQGPGQRLYYDFIEAYDLDAQSLRRSEHPWYDYAPYREWQHR